MGIRILFLKLVDLLLYSMVVKSKAGLTKLEEQDGNYVTPLETYIWVFLMNERLGIRLSEEQQNGMARVLFWMWQMVWDIKTFTKEKRYRNKLAPYNVLFTQPYAWLKTHLQVGDIMGKTALNVYRFNREFTKEVNNSNLDKRTKASILQTKTRATKTCYQCARSAFCKGFDFHSIEEYEKAFDPIYSAISELQLHIYCSFVGLPTEGTQWKSLLTFSKNLFYLSIAHNDVVDFHGIIMPDGNLNEPNIFACYLTHQERVAIGRKYNGVITHTPVAQAETEYPRAYRQFYEYIRQKLRTIDLIPGINLHELLEFYFLHYPVHYIVHISPQYSQKRDFIMRGFDTLALLENNKMLIDRFRNQILHDKSIRKSEFTKKYQDLVCYLYAQQMHHSGMGLTKISEWLRLPISTIAYWTQGNRVPLSLRSKKLNHSISSYAHYYLLGYLTLKGSVTRDGIKIVRKNKSILMNLQKMLSPHKASIHKEGSAYIFRLMHRASALSLINISSQLPETIKALSIHDKKAYIAGILDTQINANSLIRIPAPVGEWLAPILSEYFEMNGKHVTIRKDGKYMLLRIKSSKFRHGEEQNLGIWERVLSGEKQATQEYLMSMVEYGKSIVRRYFGSQKSDFWAELTSLMYICIQEGLDAYLQTNESEGNFRSFLKYHVLTHFRKYFKTKGRETTTSFVDEEVVDGGKEVMVDDGTNALIIQKSLGKLKKIDTRSYYAVALRYGLMDGKEHTLTDDLSQRLSELGITNKNGGPLSKSQTYHLILNGIERIKSLSDC